MGNTSKTVDDLLESHEVQIRRAQSLEKGVQLPPPDTLELCYFGFRIINEFPDKFEKYLDILEGYARTHLINEKTKEGIACIIKRNVTELPAIGIGAVSYGDKIISQLQPQTQH